jgi:hypothetical protein
VVWLAAWGSQPYHTHKTACEALEALRNHRETPE